jgi:integrase
MGVKVREKPKGSGSWWVFIDYQNRRKAVKVGGKREAQTRAKDIETALLFGNLTNPEGDPADTLFKEYAEGWLAGKKATRRHGTYLMYHKMLKTHLLPVFGGLPLRDISRAQVRQLCAEKVSKGLAPTSTGVVLTTLRGILSQAVDDGILPNNVAAKAGTFIPKPEKKIPEFLSPEAAEVLLAAAREKYPVIYPAILLGLRAGLRVGEICGLEWADIDLDAKTLTVRRTVAHGSIGPTKSGGERTIPMSAELEAALKARRTSMAEASLKAGRPMRYVYPATDSGPVWPNWIRINFFKVLKSAEIPTVHFHALRHSFGSHLVETGAPLSAVRDFLGHSSLTMTDRYIHSVSDGRKIIKKLDEAGKSATIRNLGNGRSEKSR